MSNLDLLCKNIKIQHIKISYCPNPQMTERCQGKFLKSRAWQVECVECMKIHKTLEKHPLLKSICPLKPVYKARSINELE